MPAISPERLRAETESLQAAFPDPTAFMPAIERLFEFYSDRTIRHGQSGTPAPLSPMYHVPRPVLRAIVSTLAESVNSDPERALEIADLMWENPHFESKQIAIRLLAHLPNEQADQSLERVRRWPQPGVDEALLEELFAFGADQLDGFLQVVNDWLSDGNSSTTMFGLIALEASITGESIPGLPAIFRILSPLLSQPESRIKPRMAAIVRKMAAISPTETAFFLQQLYVNAAHPEIARLIRQNLDQFPLGVKEDLQESLHRQG